MTTADTKEKFLNFFKAKEHKIIPSSSLLSDDPSVLLTTAGVQQFKSYYTGDSDPEKDFDSRRVASAQKCFRTTDIDEVGDETHLTFFEMLGNFSFADYGKEEAIKLGYEFITQELGIAKDRLTVTVFEGKNEVPRDEESYRIWNEVVGLPEDKIEYALWDNFWGPTGNKGPCGPTTEIYVDGIEIWNIVFNEYVCEGSRDDLLAGKAQLNKLAKPGVDTGMGLERLAAILSGVKNVYETDLFSSIIDVLPEDLSIESKRVLADHGRGISFLISDGVTPSNKEAGYILRRLIRRIITKAPEYDFSQLLNKVVKLYSPDYSNLDREKIWKVFDEESKKFKKTLAKGIRELSKLETIDAPSAFKLYESFGLPYEVIKDLGGQKASKLKQKDFDKEFAKHQEISRAGQEKKFGGHGLLLDTGELKAGSEDEIKQVTRLHTATHLLQQSLRDVLGDEVKQKGSDITTKRTRFDFSFSRKLDANELEQVEKIINEKIEAALPVGYEELPLSEAKETGALYYFKEKYPDPVKVYYVGPSLEDAYSKEFCGGPHVTNTKEIGRFKIIKEESVGAGIRRIRGVLE
jgi:alanyl-tRNA synthetase